MENKQLPFELDVEMQTYLFGAFSLGVMKACLADYDKWLCNRLINCNCRRNLGGFWNIESEDLWSTEDGGSIHQSINIEPSTFGINGFDLITFNIEMLRRGNYISGDYNEYYIPGAQLYLKHDAPHRYILLGFDNKQQVFKSATYLSDGKYGRLDIKYCDFLKAVMSTTVPLVPINYYRINSEYKASINVKLIRKQLEDYVSSTNSWGVQDRVLYGMEAWDALAAYVIAIQSKTLDLRFVRAYMEHKKIMHKRIKTLAELSYIDDRNLSSMYLEKVCVPAKRVFSLAIKHRLTHNSELLIRISDTIRYINNCEQGLLSQVINYLS